VKTTSYEIGFKQLITKDVSIDATLFYRQMSGYVQIRNVAARPVGYALFVNGDYGDGERVELLCEYAPFEKYPDHRQLHPPVGGRHRFHFGRVISDSLAGGK